MRSCPSRFFGLVCEGPAGVGVGVEWLGGWTRRQQTKAVTRVSHIFPISFFQLRVRFSQTFLFPSTLLQTFPCVTLNKYLSFLSFHHHKRTQAHRTQCGETEIERLEGQTVK